MVISLTSNWHHVDLYVHVCAPYLGDGNFIIRLLDVVRVIRTVVQYCMLWIVILLVMGGPQLVLWLLLSLCRVDNISYPIMVRDVCGYVVDVERCVTEYLSGQQHWFDGMMVPDHDQLWLMKPPHSQGSKVILWMRYVHVVILFSVATFWSGYVLDVPTHHHTNWLPWKCMSWS